MKTRFKEFWNTEKYVVLHAQTARFRLIKWIIILGIAIGLFVWKGFVAVGLFFGIAVVLGTSMHFILRYKTKGWVQAWGPYKKSLYPLAKDESFPKP